MNRMLLWSAVLALPLVIGGLVYAGLQRAPQSQSSESGFVCPLTGEELPCPRCCPIE